MPIHSQAQNTTTPYSCDNILQEYTDSLQVAKYKILEQNTNYKETLSNPYYFPLFCGNAFNSMVLFNKTNSLLLKSTQKVLSKIYTEQPWLIDSNIPINKAAPTTEKKEIKDNQPKVYFANKYKKEPTETKQTAFAPLTLDVNKPQFWTFGSNFSFQLMQNYISDNWYKGGESNHAFLTSVIFTANYSNKRKVSFNNKLETKIGFRSTNSDTVHNYMTNSDLLRLTNQLAINAINHWDYSLLLQSWTQFSKGYKRNDRKVYSDFMSPFESVLSLGMQYSLTSKNKRFNIKLNMSPFAANFKYVRKKELIESFGLKDKHTKWELGTNITMDAHWSPFKNVDWTTRLYYFSNYKHTRVEWENTLNFQINRYLSSQIFLYPRFDDQAKRMEGKNYFQFKEYLSMGINVNL